MNVYQLKNSSIYFYGLPSSSDPDWIDQYEKTGRDEYKRKGIKHYHTQCLIMTKGSDKHDRITA